MPNIDLSILNQRQTPAFYADVFANRPAAGFVGRIFVSTDTYAFYRDNGTSWDLIGGPGTGTITGSGSSGSLALWNGTNTITYDVNITWDGTDNSISADKFIVNSGTSSQFLKGDGSLDSSAYVTDNIYNANGSLTAERTINLNAHNLIFDGGASVARIRLDADTNVARIFSFASNNLPRWAFRIDGTESGSNAGSDFAIRRYNDAGTFVDAPLTVTRSSGQSTFAKKVVIENNAGDQQLQIVSTSAPSLRFDNLQTGATKRAGLGISTAVNNFIQGSADQDFCIFNSSTTASPILFGIYDAGLTNTQEAARISPARNFLIGTTTDAGYKLDVNGTINAAGRINSGSGGGATASLNAQQLSSDDAAIYAGGVITTGSSKGIRVLAGTNSSDYALNIASYANSPIIYARGDGNVGIATTSPVRKLDVNGVTRSTAFDVFNNSALSGFLIQEQLWVGGSSTNISIAAETGNAITFYTNGAATQRAQISTSGNLLIGTTTDAGQKLQVNGDVATNGVKFPATQVPSADVNTLDDYEEGTFVPELNFGGANVGMTYFDKIGNYTKIGRQVTVCIYLALTAVGSSTGNATITNLPFTVGTGNRGFLSPGSIRFDNITYTGMLQIFATSSSNSITFEQVSNLGVESTLTNSNFSSSTELSITMTYFV